MSSTVQHRAPASPSMVIEQTEAQGLDGHTNIIHLFEVVGSTAEAVAFADYHPDGPCWLLGLPVTGKPERVEGIGRNEVARVAGLLRTRCREAGYPDVTTAVDVLGVVYGFPAGADVPDGLHVIPESEHPGDYHLYVVDAEGRAVAEIPFSLPDGRIDHAEARGYAVALLAEHGSGVTGELYDAIPGPHSYVGPITLPGAQLGTEDLEGDSLLVAVAEAMGAAFEAHGDADYPDGTGEQHRTMQRAADAALELAYTHERDSWRHYVEASVTRTLVETDPAQLRVAIVDAMATLGLWVKAIERRTAATPDGGEW